MLDFYVSGERAKQETAKYAEVCRRYLADEETTRRKPKSKQDH